MKKTMALLSLLTSSATLLCCALPFLLVSLGAGAVLAGIASNVPQLIWVSEHKNLVFIVAGLLLILSYFIRKKATQLNCPIDKQEACSTAKDISHIILNISIAIYCLGFFFAYVLPWLQS